jgi:hypothetical protein
VLGLMGYTLQYPAEGGPSSWSSTPQKRDFNVTHRVCDEGAVGSAPRLRDNPLRNRNAFTGSFLHKKEVLP